MPFSGFDAAAHSRSLAQIADHQGDIADLFLERSEEVEICSGDEVPGIVVRREQGLAVRLLRDGVSWLSSRDGSSAEDLERALRQVARARPTAAYAPSSSFATTDSPPVDASEVQSFPVRLERRIRAREAAFPYALRVRRHRRWVRVIGTRLITDTAAETYYSVEVDMPWGRYGCLTTTLADGFPDEVAERLVDRFRAREAKPPDPVGERLVLGEAATAVLLHEAVAHALEADTLVLGGRPEAACGLELGSEKLNVLDDPQGLPESIAREFDDEGVPVTRRWLLQDGMVRQPLADLFFAAGSDALTPGAGRRSSRHSPPGPRSSHLELLPGETGWDDLIAAGDGGLFLPEVSSGSLDPVSGELVLRFPYGRRIEGGRVTSTVGPCRLESRVSEVLAAVAEIGDHPRLAGAGWCAKNAQRLPVWATCPPILLAGLKIET